jgi:hypothetical protein
MRFSAYRDQAYSIAQKAQQAGMPNFGRDMPYRRLAESGVGPWLA